MLHDCTTTSPAGHRGDALVTRGAPAGSTTAMLLVEKGFQAAPLEKAYPPRFIDYLTSLAIVKHTPLEMRGTLNSRSPEASEEVCC